LGVRTGFSLAEVDLVTLLLLNERVFWEPLTAGPPEVRDLRVGGILVV